MQFLPRRRLLFQESLCPSLNRREETKGQWLFTFQDCPQIRALMHGYPIKGFVRANGIGNNGRVRAGRKYREVVITSLPRAAAQKAA